MEEEKELIKGPKEAEIVPTPAPSTIYSKMERDLEDLFDELKYELQIKAFIKHQKLDKLLAAAKKDPKKLANLEKVYKTCRTYYSDVRGYVKLAEVLLDVKIAAQDALTPKSDNTIRIIDDISKEK